MSFTLEFLFVAKWVVISGEPGGLCLSEWQDRRGEIGDGEIGMARLVWRDQRGERVMRMLDRESERCCRWRETSDRRKEKK